MNPTLRLASCLALILTAPAAVADVRMPAIFSDHMVLQADASLPVWGWADPGEKVTVRAGNRSATATTGADGRWSVALGRLKAGQSLTMTVTGNNTVTIRDVLVGQVWLGSGQSNMEWPVRLAANPEAEAAAARFPEIRMFTVRKKSTPAAQTDCEGSWIICSPETVPHFSATLYFFGRALHRELGQPVGLINSSWGGTPVESWTSPEAQQDRPELKPLLDSWTKRVAVPYDAAKARADHESAMAAWREASAKAQAEGKPAPRQPQMATDQTIHHWRPGNLYNAMIAPLVPYALAGAVWYQGESNAGSNENGALYHDQLSLLIRDWRARWDAPLPFGFVQLPEYRAPVEAPVQHNGWVLVRESMLKTLALPKTGMAITLGLGEANDIHPKNKQDVGQRLAFWALDEVYGQKVAASSGPLPSGHRVRGGEVIVTFAHTDGGLRANGGVLKGFAIAGEDKKWVRAEARIDGRRVVVSSPSVPKPVAVRYAWADNPDFSLFNGAGLPASPFRTDDWK